MTSDITQNERKARTEKINKTVKITTLIFVVATILHMYFFQGDWSFITSFFSANPIPWIMLVFTALISYFFYATYMYFRKHL